MTLLNFLAILAILIAIPVAVLGQDAGSPANESRSVVYIVRLLRFFLDVTTTMFQLALRLGDHIILSLRSLTDRNFWHQVAEIWRQTTEPDRLPCSPETLGVPAQATGGSFDWNTVEDITAHDLQAFEFVQCPPAPPPPAAPLQPLAMAMPDPPMTGCISPAVSEASVSLSSISFGTTTAGDPPAEPAQSAAPGPSATEVTHTFPHTNAWYAVIRGLDPGVYYDWYNAAQEVYGVPHNYYRTFKTEREARMFYDAEVADGNVRVLSG